MPNRHRKIGGASKDVDHTKLFHEGKKKILIIQHSSFLQARSNHASNVKLSITTAKHKPPKTSRLLFLYSNLSAKVTTHKKKPRRFEAYKNKNKKISRPKRPKRQICQEPGRRTQQCLLEVVVFFPEGGRAGWAVDVVVPVRRRDARVSR
jgi:hypothetical protein